MKLELVSLLLLLAGLGVVRSEQEVPSENFKKEMKEYLAETRTPGTGPTFPAMKENEPYYAGIEPSRNVIQAIIEDYFFPQDRIEMPAVKDREVKVMQAEEDSESLTEYCETIFHGNDIVFQSAASLDEYIGALNNQLFFSNQCFGLHVSENEWQSCKTYTFQPYRMKGPGPIHVGDMIGLYNPDSEKWFQCSGAHCVKDDCPGKPSSEHGFSSQNNWFTCPGSVYEIFAYGKEQGEIITNKDLIRLYFLQADEYISVKSTHYLTRSGSCNTGEQPPPEWQYDNCVSSVFIVHKKIKQ